jgi:hypothetical protein
VKDADRGPGAERREDRDGCRHLVAVGQEQQRRDDTGHAADVADREVDLPQEQDEDDAHADDRVGGHLHDEVDEVAGGEELVVLRLEDDRDDDQADEDRQRAEVAALDALPPAAGGVLKRLAGRRDGGRCGLRHLDRSGGLRLGLGPRRGVGRGPGRGAHAITSSV